MNIYSIIILSTLIISFLVEIIADFINLRSLKNDVPILFRNDVDQDAYSVSQEYTRTKTKFGMITSAFSMTTILVFWFVGGFNYLDLIISPLTENQIVRGVLYIGILVLVQWILSVPFSLYSIFVIEEKFGFNKTTIKTFILDIVKSAALAIILGVPFLALILYILEATGPAAWIYGFSATVIFILIMQYVAPNWIMPLFNKFIPLEDENLKTRIIDYCNTVSFPVKNIYIMDGSKRSSKSNAFFTGFGKNKRIVLFDTLVAQHSSDELVAILAHEVGHYKKKHVLKGLILSIIHFGFLFWLLSIFLNERGLYEAFFMQQQMVYTGIVFFGLLYSPLEVIISLILNALSRKNEYEADKFAVETTGLPDQFIESLKKLYINNKSNLTPHRLYVFINYSHPPVIERIQKIIANERG